MTHVQRMGPAGRLRFVALTTLAMGLATACGSADDKTGPAPVPTEGTDTTWNPSGETGSCNVDALLGPNVYGSKVKTLLTGLPLSEAELAQLEDDPEALKGLVDGWLQMPEAELVLRKFFMSAFQQNALDRESFFYLLGHNATATGFYDEPGPGGRSATVHEMLNQNFSESFARTVVALLEQGTPFNEVITTDTYMMTTAMMMYLAFIDDRAIDDDGEFSVRTTASDFETLTIVRDAVDAPPASEALDPNSPGFGTFYHADLGLLPQSCNVQASQTVYANPQNDQWRIASAQTSTSYFVFGQLIGMHEPITRDQAAGCNTGANRSQQPLLERSDFNDWHEVSVIPVGPTEQATKFYLLPDLRSASSMKLYTDRLGFFSTPGFMGSWPNNEDNSARVTINQILIVALGASFDGVAVSDFSPESLNEEHADPTTQCFGCHQTLDPMREYIRASYTNFYGKQLDPTRQALAADFIFGGVEAQGNGIRDLAQVLKTHPWFASGWAQKLCYYANSEACPEGAELDRVTQAFVDSSYDFHVLVRELFSSPLITGSACIDGVDAGTTATIKRRSLFCIGLAQRLGIDDICGTFSLPEDSDGFRDDMRSAISSVPDDSFSRSVVAPVVIAETSMFTRANKEAACIVAADQGFDLMFEGVAQDDLLPTMVSEVMGLPPTDERYAAALAILEEHVTAAMAEGQDESTALQSAFVLSCMSPGSAGIGF